LFYADMPLNTNTCL